MTEIETLFVQVVSRIVADVFHGKAPEDPTVLVAATLRCFVPLDPRAAGLDIDFAIWEKVRDAYTMGLVVACDCLRRQQTAKWKN